MLKLQIHKAKPDKLAQADPFADDEIDEANIFNQVGIVALGALGVPLARAYQAPV